MKRLTNLEEAMCKELEKLDKKYSGDVGEMTMQDVEKADLLLHAMKSAETYYAMAGEGEWTGEGSGEQSSYRGDRSYRRGRDSMGRFTSRDMGSGYSSYDGYSGHAPWMPPYRY